MGGGENPLHGPAMRKPADDIAFIEHVGRRVAAARRARGWSQERLADAIQVEPTTLSRLETGKRPFALPLLYRIAKRLGVSPATFVDVEVLDGTGLPEDETELLTIWRSLRPDGRTALIQIARQIAPHHVPALAADGDR